MEYRIKISELEQKLREAHEGGWSTMVIINGEYYSINYEVSPLKVIDNG